MRWLVRMLLLAWALALAACANTAPEQPKLVWHSFSFNGWHDGKWSEKIDLLAYSYGDKYRMVSQVENPSGERIPSASGVSGPMPVGEFLYVKWRIKATGEVLEDRVDLRPLLPKDMTDYKLTFVPDGSQLYIYLVTPTPTHPIEPPPLKTAYSCCFVTYEIYPHNTFPLSQH
ncbi:MAG: hypothetical protein FWG56_03195 [Desulfovibrionaceae bacterium]|nr:hypothetical protein [Desulfovibrionaceae bacterium]